MRMPTDAESCALLRQLSGRSSIGKPRRSRRFANCDNCVAADDEGWEWEELSRKKVIAVVDGSAEAKVAMLWALSHVVNRLDTLTLLHVIDPSRKGGHDARHLATSLAALCKSRRPEAEVEAVVVEGEKAVTIVSQTKKLQASLLVLGQRKPSLFQSLQSFPAQKGRGRGLLHTERRVLGAFCKEAEQRRRGVPHQQQMAEKFLAFGVKSLARRT